MKPYHKCYVIDDYTEAPIWDGVQALLEPLETSPRLDSGEKHKHSSKPPGNWDLRYAMYPLASDGAFANAGIRKPEYKELPCVFIVTENGDVKMVVEHVHVTTPEQAIAILTEVSHP